MAKNEAQETVNVAIKTVLKEQVEKQQQQAFEDLRKQCQLFLKRIDKIVQKNTAQGQLIYRVQFLGELFHGENATNTQVSDLIIIAHEFESSLNKYLGRQIPLTIVSKAGDINILSEKTTIDIYKKAEADAKGNRGHVSGYNEEITKNRLHNPALTRVQKALNESIKNRKAVFGEALYRLNNSKKMDYASDPQNAEVIPNLYWIINSRHEKKWTPKAISNSGYIGQGYTSLALDSDTIPSKLITYKHDPLEYDVEAEQQIKLLSHYAESGDAIPGILQGDVKVGSEGTIQLAVKQNNSFRTAGIGTNFSIAYAILSYPQNELIMPQDLQKSLESISEKSSGSWQNVYKILTGKLKEDASTMELNIILT